MYKVQIMELDNGGFDVKIGCQEFFYLTLEAMMLEVNTFLKDPRNSEKSYMMWRDSKEKSARPVRAGVEETVDEAAASSEG